jgi:hypothetical protein
MSVAMDIMRALDPTGLQRFKINLDTPAEQEKIGEVWTIKVVPYLETEVSRKEFNKLFDNNKNCKSWVVESKQEVIDVLQDIHRQSGKTFDEKALQMEDFSPAGRYTILIHIRDIWE